MKGLRKMNSFLILKRSAFGSVRYEPICRYYLVNMLSHARYAGFWLRAVAALVDLMVLGVVLAVFVSFLAVANGISLAFLELHPGEPPSAIFAAFGTSGVYQILFFFLVSSWIYFAVMESSVWQGTVGKKLLAIHVANLEGTRVTFMRASGRFFGGRLLLHVPYVGGLNFTVDCVCAAVTSRKQALHDLMAGCAVLRNKKSGFLISSATSEFFR